MNSFLLNPLGSFSLLLLFLFCCFALVLMFCINVVILPIGVIISHWCCYFACWCYFFLHSYWCFTLMMLLCGSHGPSSPNPIVVILMLVLLLHGLVSLVSLVLPPSCSMQLGAWNTKSSRNHEVNFFPVFALVSFIMFIFSSFLIFCLFRKIKNNPIHFITKPLHLVL